MDENDSQGSLPEGERKVLSAVAMYAEGIGRETISVLTGYKRSSRDAYVQRLKSRGYVETAAGGVVLATEAGIAALGSSYEPLPTGRDLQTYWLQRLPEGERVILGILIERYPGDVPRGELDAESGYKRSSRDAYLQRLKARKLVTTAGGSVRASDDLF